MEIIGWIGGICFAISGLPQSIKSIKEGHSEGVSWGLLILWFIGEICTLIYILPKNHLPLITNYLLNIIFVSIIIWYKIRPRRLHEDKNK